MRQYICKTLQTHPLSSNTAKELTEEINRYFKNVKKMKALKMPSYSLTVPLWGPQAIVIFKVVAIVRCDQDILVKLVINGCLWG